MKKALLLVLLLLGVGRAQQLDLRSLAGAGNVTAQYNLAMQYDQQGLPANSLYWLFRAARQGHPMAQYNLAQRYRTGKTVQANPQQFKRWLEGAARAGLVNAQTQLALWLENSDPLQAYVWLLRATVQPYPPALQALERLKQTLTPEQQEQAQNLLLQPGF